MSGAGRGALPSERGKSGEAAGGCAGANKDKFGEAAGGCAGANKDKFGEAAGGCAGANKDPMALLRYHVPYFTEIFSLPGFLTEPILLFGFQDTFGFRPTQLEDQASMSPVRRIKKLGLVAVEALEALLGKRHHVLSIPNQFKAKDMVEILHNFGFENVTVLDYFDQRAGIIHDMNLPINEELRLNFNTIIDVGSLEHVFDTRQCLDNLFSMLKLNGHIMLHAPCKGYFDHGLHTFSPECILESLRLNGLAAKFVKYSSPTGIELNSPDDAQDVLLWVVAQKLEIVSPFKIPMQGRWKTAY